jgi:HK97 family phage major capsid protein
MTTYTDEAVQRLRTRLGRKKTERRSMVETAKRHGGDTLTADQAREFRDLTTDIEAIEDRVEELLEQEQRSSASNDVTRRIASANVQAGESRVYGPESRSSYFADLVAMSRQTADYSARERLQTYEQEQRDLNRADGSGGAFVPPAWLVSDYVGLPRAGRVTADLLTRRPLPSGTDVINIPKILTGTAAAIQPADNDPVQEVDLTDSSIAAPVRTIAGQQDVAVQLLDQSPINYDEMIFRDLRASFDQQLGNQVLSGSGALGQVLGLRNVTGASAVTLTGTTTAALYGAVANAATQVQAGLFAAPNALVMHPRRWAYLTSQLDASGRPLVVPEAYGPNNAAGLVSASGEGRVGNFAGLPVYLDSNIPTNVGTNQDVILVLNTGETYLYESQIRTRVMQETLSGTLTVRVQLYGYVAMATRQAKSVAVISGAGLAAPVFA